MLFMLLTHICTILKANATRMIPLDEPWTNRTLQIHEISNEFLPATNHPILWVDETGNMIYTFAGDASEPNTTYQSAQQYFKLSSDLPNGLTWSTANPANDKLFANLRKPSRSASTVCNGVGYALGGYGSAGADNYFAQDDNSSARIAVPGLLTYNFSTRVWANESIRAPFAAGTNPFGGDLNDHYPSGGYAVCLPDVGDAWVVMFFGGRAYSGDGREKKPMPFSHMLFYDVARKQFRWQDTTGAESYGLPRARRDGCATIAKGKNGTYEV